MLWWSAGDVSADCLLGPSTDTAQDLPGDVDAGVCGVVRFDCVPSSLACSRGGSG